MELREGKDILGNADLPEPEESPVWPERKGPVDSPELLVAPELQEPKGIVVSEDGPVLMEPQEYPELRAKLGLTDF